MFERLFPRAQASAPAPSYPATQLALGVLLVRVALADHSYRASESAAIDRILSASFGLKPLAAAKLRAACTDLTIHAADWDRYARILAQEVPYSERQALAHAMWQVCLADGERHDLEEDMLHRIEAALDLTDADSQAARDAALGAQG